MIEPHKIFSLFNLKKLKELSGFKVGDLLAVDPQIRPKLIQHLSKTVKHDDVTKNMVVLTGLSAFTREPINLFLRGESSIGKTYVTCEALKYFPKENVWFLGGLSPTALVHDRGKLVDEAGEEIDLSKKPEKPRKSDYPDKASFVDAYTQYREENERWIERLKNSRYLVELSGKILVFLEAPHIETFNKLRPVLSHDNFQISYKFTDKSSKGKLQTQHVVIEGFPATIFCSTEEKYIQDLATRSFTVTPETTEQKYRDANVLTGSKASFPWRFGKDFDFRQLESYIRFVRDNLENFDVIVPYGHVFGQNFPTRFPRSMRDFKHILSLIKVSALFHFAQRPILILKREDNEEKLVLASKQDFEFVMGLWDQIRETTETSAPGQIIKFYHEVVKPLSKKMAIIHIQDLVDEWNSKFEDKRSSGIVRKWVNFLSDIGYVNKSPDTLDKRRNVITVIRENEKNGNYEHFDLCEIFGLDLLKEWLNEAKQIFEKSDLTLKQNLVANGPATIEDIFEKFYLSKTRRNSNIEVSDSNVSLAERTEEKTEKKKTSQFPDFNIDEVLKLERLELGFNDKCVMCGFEGPMDYQATYHNGSWGLLCGSCGLKLAEKLGKVE